MQKKSFFNKLNNNDYNNRLEEILEKKEFSMDAKNLLLSMFYKIEVSYKDFKTVKREIIPETVYIEDLLKIIDEKVENIVIVNPKTEESKILERKNKEAIVDNNIIISYPTEKALLLGILEKSKKEYIIKNNYFEIKSPFEEILAEGEILNNLEVIYNFDGWAWNNDIKEKKFNFLLYYNLIALCGKQFFYEWKNENLINIDYIKYLKANINSRYGEENGKEFFKIFYQLLLIMLKKHFQNEAEKLLENKEELFEKSEEILSKTKYLNYLSVQKKEKRKKIKEIDSMLSKKDIDNESLLKERKILLDKIQEYNFKATPEGYLHTKYELQKKINVINFLNNQDISEKEQVIILQKQFIKCLIEKINTTETKKELIEIIFKTRYYKQINFLENTIYQLDELKEDIDLLDKIIIKKGYDLKIFLNYSEDINLNYYICKILLNTRIVDIEHIKIKLEVENYVLDFNIYDKGTLESKQQIEVFGTKINYANKLIKFIN